VPQDERHRADGVFEGGGVKGIAFAGAIAAAERDAGVHEWVNVAGTSAMSEQLADSPLARELGKTELTFADVRRRDLPARADIPDITDDQYERATYRLHVIGSEVTSGTSAICIRPPGRSTRWISLKTASLSGIRSITPLETTMSKLSSRKGRCSASLSRNSTAARVSGALTETAASPHVWPSPANPTFAGSVPR
jgi:hypothetical protein